MKVQSLIALASAGSLAFGATVTLTQPSFAQGQGFYCDTSTGVPITMYQNSTGGIEPWIKWTSKYFKTAGYTPLTRCQEVSGRLENYRRNKQLKFITVGNMNGQPVVCTASQVNGRCEGLIFTLRPREDAVKTLTNLLAWREGQAGTPSVNEGPKVRYIDVRDRLGDDGENSAQPTTPVTNVQPNLQP